MTVGSALSTDRARLERVHTVYAQVNPRRIGRKEDLEMAAAAIQIGHFFRIA